jgi:ATP-dependent DNA helicase RecQ
VVGAKTKKLLQLGHDKLPTHGVGKGRKKIFWRRLVDAMLADGLLAVEGGKYPLLHLTTRGEEVLYGRQSFTLHLVREIATETAVRSAPEQVHPDLFERLREVRRVLAEEQNVPPYVVFSDKSLHDMCRLLPDTENGLLAVHGVGRAKLERYGRPFLAEIAAWLAEHPEVERPLLPDAPPPPAAPAGTSATVEASGTLALQGLSLEQIAAKRGLKPSTIAAHLETFLDQGNRLDPDLLIGREKKNMLQEQNQHLGCDFLKPVVSELQGRAGYEEARIVRAWLNQAHR